MKGMRSGSRGSALIFVFVLMFVMLTLVAGLHYRQSSARASLFHADANLQARIAAEVELARHCHPTGTFSSPSGPVQGALQKSSELAPTPLAAKNLFSKSGLVDLAKAQTLKSEKLLSARPGLFWNSIKVSSSDPSMQPDKARYLAVISESFPYAACAPQGQIEASEAMAWRNQVFSNIEFPTQQAFSGGSARLAAGGNITLGKCSYGELFSTSGTIRVEEGRFVAFQGPPADLVGPTAYPNQVRQQVQQAIDRLSAQAFDKTPLFTGAPLGVDLVLDLFKGKADSALASALSLRQAMRFPFLMLPGGRIKGVIVNVWLHMPYAPDGGSSQSRVESISQEKQGQIDGKLSEIEAKNKQIEEAKKQAEAETDPQRKQDAQKVVKAREAESEGLLEGLQGIQKELDSEIESALETSKAEEDKGPANRAGEVGMDDKGVPGFSYGPFYKKLLDFCLDCVISAFTGKAPDLDKWAKSLYQEVRLVHFGAKDYDTDFTIDETQTELTATFNVPSARAIKLRGNVKIKGDLWLMRGATLVVQGNLDLESPLDATSLDPRKPRGRIFMEEGANLVVSGNLTCQGAPALGSILVGSPVDAMHAGTSCILVQGDVTIPFGVWPAFSLGDLDLSQVPELSVMRDVLGSVAPNLAKLVGPFHRRKPYFSKFATNFVVACLLTPIGPIPVPVPAPIPNPENANVKVFRAMSMIYSTQMNLAWGENFITHCDWWFLGQGTVPMFPKINPTVYLDKLKNLSFPDLPDVSQVEKWLKDKGPELVEKMVPRLLADVIVKLVVSQLTMGFGDIALGVLPLDEWLDKVLGAESLQGSLAEIAGLDGLANSIRDKVGDTASLILLHEIPGILIYSGGTLKVGSDTRFPVPLTIGMLVASKDVISGAAVTAGAALSLEGNVSVKRLFYDPNSTRCSLYLPTSSPRKVTTMDWLDWALEVRFGKFFENNEAVDIGPQLRHSTLQGWIQ